MHWQHVVIDPNAFNAHCHHQPHSSLGSWSFPHTHWCKPPTGTMSGMGPSPLADQPRFSYFKQLTGEGQFAKLCSGQVWPTPTWTDCDTSAVVFGAAEEDVTERRHKTALRTVLPRRTIEKLDSSHPLSCLKQPAMRNKEQSHQPRQVTEGCQGLPKECHGGMAQRPVGWSWSPLCKPFWFIRCWASSQKPLRSSRWLKNIGQIMQETSCCPINMVTHVIQEALWELVG